MRKYLCLNKQIFSTNKYSIVPIRDEDKYAIMHWRNEQIYHLRQTEALTKEKQEWYYENIVAKLFEEEKPNQILFSYLEEGICIGYGGLVHINWIDKNAEISFIMNTKLEAENFEFHWSVFLQLLEKPAFEELLFHKIYTYAFDIRPLLYKALESSSYKLEARLTEHCLFQNNFIDVLIHSKINPISLRVANINDLTLYFDWTNDPEVREKSFNSKPISLDAHTEWFNKKIIDTNCMMLVGQTLEKTPVGQVRFEKDNVTNTSIVGISVDKEFRGRGLASKILTRASNYFLNENPEYTIEAYIKINNQESISVFSKAGFIFNKYLDYHGIESVLYTKSNL